MTIAIGILSDDGIVFASDSQSTRELTGQKSLESKKIFKIPTSCFQTHSEIVIAHAGEVAIAKMVIGKMEEICAATPFADKRAPLEAMRRAIRETKAEMLQAAGREAADASEREDYFNRHESEFILGYYHYGYKYQNPEAQLFAISFCQGLEFKPDGRIAMIGSGAMLASFLAKLFNFEELNLSEASAAAVYILDEVTQQDVYCSGDFQLWALFRPQYRDRLHFAAQQTKPKIEKLKEEMASLRSAIPTLVKREIGEALKRAIQATE